MLVVSGPKLKKVFTVAENWDFYIYMTSLSTKERKKVEILKKLWSPYPKILNYENIIRGKQDYVEKNDDIWITTEKVHGANFSYRNLPAIIFLGKSSK